MTEPVLKPFSAMNYVFVDYENVHEVDLAIIGNKRVSITLLMGARQTKLDVAIVEKLLEHAGSVQLVRLTGSGRNALDFAVAFYLGRAVTADPGAFFHIITKDTGFEPLIEHLRSRHVKVRRHENFASLNFTDGAKPLVLPVEDLMPRVLAHLQKNTTNRPKRKKTLASHLHAFTGKTASEGEIEKLIQKLCKAGHINLGEKDAVTYSV